MTKIIKVKTKHFSNRASGAKINAIIIHHTAIGSLDSVLAWFKNDESRVSSHYVIDRDGTIYQVVDDDKKAWHAGISNWRGVENLNNTSIGIELVNTGYESFDTRQISALIELCRGLKKKYDIPDHNIIGHSDIAPSRKIDPSIHFDWDWLHDNGLGLMSVANFLDPKILYRYGDEKDEICELKRRLQKFGYFVAEVESNRYDLHLDYIVKAFKRHYSPDTYDTFGWDEQADARLNDLLEMIEVSND